MIPTFAKAGIGLLAIASIACMAIDTKYEVVANYEGGGTVCEIGSANWQGQTLVEFEPQIGLGGFSFGSSGLMSTSSTGSAPLWFESYDLLHVVDPTGTWGDYVLTPPGSGDIHYVSI